MVTWTGGSRLYLLIDAHVFGSSLNCYCFILNEILAKDLPFIPKNYSIVPLKSFFMYQEFSICISWPQTTFYFFQFEKFSCPVSFNGIRVRNNFITFLKILKVKHFALTCYSDNHHCAFNLILWFLLFRHLVRNAICQVVCSSLQLLTNIIYWSQSLM